ncbi:MAG: hypothetical protein HKM24_02445 [Gammaproteobacteria bacterium]|nr:hypothetical protein [Gammaproteobacteria bacterium]
MTDIDRKSAKHWKQWNRLYKSIQAETKNKKLEKHSEKIYDWQRGDRPIDEKTHANFASILNDELRRKKEQLRNKPGRQPAFDWLESLKNTSSRMDDEVAALQFLASSNQSSCKNLQETKSLIRQGLELTTQLVVRDLDQITKRQTDGEIAPDQQQLELIEFSNDMLNTATSLLEQSNDN